MFFNLKTGLIVLLLLFYSSAVSAMNIVSIYKTSCNRETGVIIKVDDEKVTLLGLDGTIRKLSRYEIIYLSYYPASKLPVEKVNIPEGFQIARIKTLHNGKIVELAQGWPIEFSDQEVSILTLKGNETIVKRDNIWDFEYIEAPWNVHFDFQKVGKEIYFKNPYPFENCVQEIPQSSERIIVSPHHIVGDPFRIKDELDRLQEYYENLLDYQNDKQFYPVPHVYKDETFLGLWLSLGSRYGSSQHRSSNFNPLFVDNLSEGPFGFQRTFVTGSAPMPFSLHEEPQSQFYYKLKADYVHFSFMYDYNRFLIGEEKYKWSKDDLDDNDSRINEIQHIAGGFDYGRMAIEYAWTSTQYGIEIDDQFFRHRVNLDKFGIFYRDWSFSADLYYGFTVDGRVFQDFPGGDATEDQAKYERLRAEELAKPKFLNKIKFYRLNLRWPSWGQWNPLYSIIFQKMDFYQEAGQLEYAIDFPLPMYFKTQNLTQALYLDYPFDEDLKLSFFGSIEAVRREFGNDGIEHRERKYYFKLGSKIVLEL